MGWTQDAENCLCAGHPVRSAGKGTVVMIEDQDRNRDGVVLVVDDDMAMRRAMRDSLEGAGLTVMEAGNDIEALAIFKRSRPDLVMINAAMSELDGIAVCSGLRELPEAQDATIVMVTDVDDLDSIERFFDAGATDFITKAVNGPILIRRVLHLIEAGEALRTVREIEERLAQVQRAARIGNWDWDLATDEMSFSEEALRMLGLASDERLVRPRPRKKARRTASTTESTGRMGRSASCRSRLNRLSIVRGTPSGFVVPPRTSANGRKRKHRFECSRISMP